MARSEGPKQLDELWLEAFGNIEEIADAAGLRGHILDHSVAALVFAKRDFEENRDAPGAISTLHIKEPFQVRADDYVRLMSMDEVREGLRRRSGNKFGKGTEAETLRFVDYLEDHFGGSG